jgi:RNA polymerase sigma factor (sigma-70 family)
MPNDPIHFDQYVKRMLPVYNNDADDRKDAWNAYLQNGGRAALMNFLRFKNFTHVDHDDILQETILTGYQKVEAGKYQDRDLPFNAFLKVIARYKIFEASRLHRREVTIEEYIDLPDHAPSREYSRVERWKENESMQRALDAMPSRRASILMMYQAGYETSEIAAMYGITEDLVRKEKSLAVRQLREALPLAKAS